MTDTDDATDVSDVELTTVIAILDDEYARQILTAVDEKPRTAAELAELCGVSDTTVYRHLDRLQSAELITKRTRPRADGHHESVYAATLAEVSIRLRDGQLECDLDQQTRDVADDLTRLWEGF